MHLTSRDQTIDQLAASVNKLTGRHATELRHLLGNPPDPANVPPAFWAEIREEMDRELAAALMLLFLASVDTHGGDVDALEGLAKVHASQRSAAQAARYSDAVKARLDRLAEGYPGAPASAGDGPTRNDIASGPDAKKINEELKGTFDAQGERIASTESTLAETAGGDAAAIEKNGALSPDDIWRPHPSRTKSGTCNRCRQLNNVKRKQWGEIDADAAGGPPLHDNCACTIDYWTPSPAQTGEKR